MFFSLSISLGCLYQYGIYPIGVGCQTTFFKVISFLGCIYAYDSEVRFSLCETLKSHWNAVANIIKLFWHNLHCYSYMSQHSAWWYLPGNTNGGSITVPLTGLESAAWQLTIVVFICKTDQSKTVQQDVNRTLILPPLVFPGFTSMTLKIDK